jgi:hypothetical protein
MIRPHQPQRIVDWNIHLGLLAEPSRDGRQGAPWFRPVSLEVVGRCCPDPSWSLLCTSRQTAWRHRKVRIAPEAPTLAIGPPLVAVSGQGEKKIAVTVDACRFLHIYTFRCRDMRQSSCRSQCQVLRPAKRARQCQRGLSVQPSRFVGRAVSGSLQPAIKVQALSSTAWILGSMPDDVNGDANVCNTSSRWPSLKIGFHLPRLQHPPSAR